MIGSPSALDFGPLSPIKPALDPKTSRWSLGLVEAIGSNANDVKELLRHLKKVLA